MNAAGLRLSLGTAAVKQWCTTGQACFNAGVPFWNQLRALGADRVLAVLEIDEPLDMVLSHPAWLETGLPRDYNYAVEQTAEFIRLVRQNYPGIKIVEQEAYPDLSRSTLTNWIYDLTAACRARGVAGPDYFEIDHDWNAPYGTGYGQWNWTDIGLMRDQAHASGVGFGVVFWAPTAVTDGQWYDGVMRQGSAYELAGVTPDLYSILSWLTVPQAIVPDTLATTSFMGTAHTFIARGFFPAPAPPTNMARDSAVTGCPDLRWSSPVLKDSAAACEAYCAQNGADACEWNVWLECYVEFGTGCTVQGGFTNWYAIVFHSQPAVPGNLNAGAVSTSQINVSWTDNSGNETGFSIERCTGGGCGNFGEIAQVGANTTSFANGGLAASTTYRYRVRAFNGGGSSATSNIAEATTQAVPPPPPPPPPSPTTISFQASNGQWMVAENNGGGTVNANRCCVGPWETFTLVDFNGGALYNGDQVALRTGSGLYLQAQYGGGGAFLAVGGGAWAWETFTVVLLSGGDNRVDDGDYVALRSSNGYYVVAEGGGGDIVNANRPAIGGWETWRVWLR